MLSDAILSFPVSGVSAHPQKTYLIVTRMLSLIQSWGVTAVQS